MSESETATLIAPDVVLTRCPKPQSHTGMVTMVAIDAGAGGVVLVDSGMSEYMPAALSPALTLLGRDVRDVTAVCSTHGHRDHTGGSRAIRELSGARSYFSPHDTDLAGFAPDTPVSGGDRIIRGDVSLDVVETPGHTAGSVCFYEPVRRLLIVGDSVQGTGSARKLPVYYGSGRQYRASIRSLLKLRIDLMVVGHPLDWQGARTSVFRGTDCQGILTASLRASEVIAAATETVRRTSLTTDLPANRSAILSRLAAASTFAHFDPGAPVEEDTDATLLSELSDLTGSGKP
ncbi:MBL fold metallo-hydrolase [Micromonospora sp. NBC_00617]|uniref:MBL fold metallo-hydrolase n=1 Tax=Micromonospora sp. NBC_00617 TaxID=2903587 RepID=UPI0030DFEC4B